MNQAPRRGRAPPWQGRDWTAIGGKRAFGAERSHPAARASTNRCRASPRVERGG